MNRSEHLQWCKDRALEYVATGDFTEAITSMMSDISKHPGTHSPSLAALCMAQLVSPYLKTPEGTKNFINGFN